MINPGSKNPNFEKDKLKVFHSLYFTLMPEIHRGKIMFQISAPNKYLVVITLRWLSVSSDKYNWEDMFQKTLD